MGKFYLRPLLLWITGTNTLLTPHYSPPFPDVSDDALSPVFMSLGHCHCRKHATTQERWQGNCAREVTMTLQGTQVKKCHRGRKWCEQENIPRDVTTRGMQARQHRKGGNDARKAIVLTLLLSTWRTIILILLVITIFFSSLNHVDLLNSMLVHCCMICCCCWECGPIAAVWWWRLPWWSNLIACLPILPSFFIKAHTSQVRQPQVRPQNNHLSNQISPPILGGWRRFK